MGVKIPDLLRCYISFLFPLVRVRYSTPSFQIDDIPDGTIHLLFLLISSPIGVGALEPGGKAWENSNYGSFVMLYAPGFATLPVGYKGDPGAYAGTSISTAFVANIIANYLSQKPEATNQEVFNALVKKSGKGK